MPMPDVEAQNVLDANSQSQVVSGPHCCKFVAVLDTMLFREAVYVDQDLVEEKLVTLNVAT